MDIKTFDIEGLKLFTIRKFQDDRGYFMERYNSNEFTKHGVQIHFVQDNHSYSHPRVLRGLHYQWEPAQTKLVTCLKGKIYDVAVDIRQGSKTYGKHVSCILDSENPQWFLIPPGFAHGFCVLGDQPAEVVYKVDAFWGAKGEGAIHFADRELDIQWPVKDPIVNGKDAGAQSFADYSKAPRF
ncbi:MAG: dTDP-4-dehydrorhamnose 3,5-epimerase [Bdellovibrionales bacterium]|nr:dTDP-4-dehydrorhamnose 3,5-epimerase [Bdellovibrionales bacterium]